MVRVQEVEKEPSAGSQNPTYLVQHPQILFLVVEIPERSKVGRHHIERTRAEGRPPHVAKHEGARRGRTCGPLRSAGETGQGRSRGSRFAPFPPGVCPRHIPGRERVYPAPGRSSRAAGPRLDAPPLCPDADREPGILHRTSVETTGCASLRSLVVGFASEDGSRPVQLLHEHQPRKSCGSVNDERDSSQSHSRLRSSARPNAPPIRKCTPLSGPCENRWSRRAISSDDHPRPPRVNATRTKPGCSLDLIASASLGSTPRQACHAPGAPPQPPAANSAPRETRTPRARARDPGPSRPR